MYLSTSLLAFNATVNTGIIPVVILQLSIFSWEKWCTQVQLLKSVSFKHRSCNFLLFMTEKMTSNAVKCGKINVSTAVWSIFHAFCLILNQDCSYWSSWSGSVNNSWLVYIAFANSLLAVHVKFSAKSFVQCKDHTVYINVMCNVSTLVRCMAVKLLYQWNASSQEPAVVV